ncbi:MAG: hypothetical protein JW936_09515 [Sedimentisphaerales bacterium]|nr:hypothetical protein [Sedimentisphaerales bacterium]
MKIISKVVNDAVASVYVAEFSEGRRVEFVESVQPPLSRDKKWVVIVSTLFGCPVGCKMCDAGGGYAGQCSADEMLAQIDYLIGTRFPNGKVETEKFKVQFARMGEPAFNGDVLAVLEQLPGRYGVDGLIPSVSTIGPSGREAFFEKLLAIKQELYGGGYFQMQFSLHSTDEAKRDWLIPVRKWSFERIAEYGEAFWEPGDRKVTLNFALGKDVPLEAGVLKRYFDPRKFVVKITPLNPTYNAAANDLVSHIDPDADCRDDAVLQDLRQAGYDVILSIGEVEENKIGSNCGQYLARYMEADRAVEGGYSYPVEQM